MPTVQTSLLSHLHRLLPAEGADADWLARFVANRDEAAFAHIVGRHGPMLWRLCRRLVGDAHLAEDCFQATFLALARQAASIRRPGQRGCPESRETDAEHAHPCQHSP